MKNLGAIIKKIKPIDAFYAFFSLAVLSRVFCDIRLNRFGIHQGSIYPDRKMQYIPLYSTTGLILEWALSIVGIIFISQKKIRAGALLIATSFLMSETQLFQNQKLLILIIACALVILPLDSKNNASLLFLRFQLSMVYFIGALHKLFNEFVSGKTLFKTFEYLHSIEGNVFLKNVLAFFVNQKICTFLSILTLIIELALPLVLIKKPSLGFFLVVMLHLSFNLFMPDILPFTLTMIGLAVLFLREKDQGLNSLDAQLFERESNSFVSSSPSNH